MCAGSEFQVDGAEKTELEALEHAAR